MLTLEEAQALAVKRNSRLWESKFGLGIVIDAAETYEYEWGWLFHYEPEDWSRVPKDHWLHRSFRWSVVDRETGRVENVGSPGVNAAIIRLLTSRPTSCQSPSVAREELGGLTKVTVSMRAFTPLRDLQQGPEPAGSIEVFRRTNG